MAPALDHVLGDTGAVWVALGGPQTLSLTTTSLVSATTRVSVQVGYYSTDPTNGTCTGVTIGGTAATRDLQNGPFGSFYLEVWSAPKPSGMASSSTISVAFANSFASGQVQTVQCAAVSMSGVDMTNGGGVQAAATSTISGAGVASWTSGSAAATGAGFAVGGWAYGCGVAETTTPTSGTLFGNYYDAGDQNGGTALYLPVAGSGSVNVGGTISTVTAITAPSGIVIYNQATASVTVTRASGFPVTQYGYPLSSLAVTTQNVGDVLVVAVGDGTHATQATGVACANVGGGFTRIDFDTYMSGNLAASLWYGIVTGTGATSITITGFSTDNVEIVADELTANAAVTWSVDVHGHGEAFPFPSLIPAVGGAEAYWGYAVGNGTLTAGATTGFTYTPTSDSDLITFNPAVAAGNTYAPAASEPVGLCSTVAAVFSAATQAVGTTVWMPSGTRPRQKLPRASARGRYIQFPWGQAACVAPWAPPPTHARVRAAFRRRPSRTSVPIVGAARPVNPLKTSRPSRPRVKPGLLRRGRTFTPGWGQAARTFQPYIRYPTSCTLGAAVALPSRQDAATFTTAYTARAAVVNYTTVGALVGTETSTSILPNTTTITYQ